MIRNYIKTAFRSLMKNKAFSLINIFGLIFSMAICLLVITIIINVNKSDDFHENKDRIYRIITLHSDKYIMNEEFATSPVPLFNLIKNDLPQIEKGVHLKRLSGNANIDSKVVKFEGLYANTDFFQTFSFDLKQGDYNDLNEPYKIFVTEQFAEKLFGNKPSVGKSIYIDDLGLFEIKGIIKNPTNPSHLRFEVIASAATLYSLEKQDKIYKFSENWTNIWENSAYLLVKPNTNIKKLEAEINKIAKENYSDVKDFNPKFSLQPLKSISPGKAMNNEIGFVIPVPVLYGLSFIAILILTITGFNYLNLSLAKSITKSKEIGIRKVLGSGRKNIIYQYITESIIILSASFAVSSVLFEYIFKLLMRLEPALSNELTLERNSTVYIVFFVFTILVGIVFGLVTSVNISKSNPLKVLKDSGNNKIITRFALRKILITSQFTVSAIFIMLTVLAFKQFSSITNKDLGFDKENLITIKLQDVSHDVLANELQNVKNITDISFTAMMPVGFGNMMTEAVLPDSPDTVLIDMLNVGYNFIDMMNIDLLAGRNYTLNDGIGNERYVIVNETATKKMGFQHASDAIGETIQLDGKLIEIIGVTKDFYYSDPMSEIKEVLIRYIPTHFQTLVVKYKENTDLKVLGKDLKKSWNKVNPNVAFSYEIYEESIKRMFKPLSFAGMIIALLSILTISISCLGLLGMVAYNSESSKKEIGIRKVMGATPAIIIKHLSKSYFKMVLIAIVISIIIIGLVSIAMKQQLPNSIGFDIPSILFGIAIIVLIAVLTIMSQTYRAASRNPVEALRYE